MGGLCGGGIGWGGMRWGGASTEERQHPGLGAVADVVQVEGDVQVVVSLREQHLVVPLVCVETRLRAGLAHTVPGIRGRRGWPSVGGGVCAPGACPGGSRVAPGPQAPTALARNCPLTGDGVHPAPLCFLADHGHLLALPLQPEKRGGGGRGVPLRGRVGPPRSCTGRPAPSQASGTLPPLASPHSSGCTSGGSEREGIGVPSSAGTVARTGGRTGTSGCRCPGSGWS